MQMHFIELLLNVMKNQAWRFRLNLLWKISDGETIETVRENKIP